VSDFAVVCLASVAGISALILARHARLALTIWLAVMIAVPVWLGISFVTVWSPSSLVAILILPAIVRAAQRQGGVGRVGILLAVYVVLATVSFAFLDTPQFAYAALFVQWLPAYFVGRYLAPECGREWTFKMMAAAATIVSIWSVLEFATGIHVFETLVDGRSGWHTIQQRGPYARSEGAFGHSIALGSFIALGIPFILSARFENKTRLMMVSLALAGVIVSFSRGAIIGAVIALVVGVYSLSGLDLPKKLRRHLILAILFLSLTLLPFVLSLFQGVSADLDPSTAYRVNLTTYIFADMQPLGPALNMEQAPNGQWVYHGFGSIDNAYIVAVLQFGWLPLLVLLLALSAAVWLALGRRNVNPGQVAIVGQVWILGTVALITQYGMAVWFVAGLAVAFSGPSRVEQQGKPDSKTDTLTALEA
jgi:hypothetical protein